MISSIVFAASYLSCYFVVLPYVRLQYIACIACNIRAADYKRCMNPLGYIEDVTFKIFHNFRFLPSSKDLNFQLSNKRYLCNVRISIVLAIQLQ